MVEVKRARARVRLRPIAYDLKKGPSAPYIPCQAGFDIYVYSDKYIDYSPFKGREEYHDMLMQMLLLPMSM